MNVKKFLFGLLWIVSGLPLVSAASISCGNVQAEAGGSVSVPVSISADSVCAAFHGRLQYDPAVVELTGVESGELLSGAHRVEWFEPASGQVNLLVSPPDNFAAFSRAGGEICLLQFHVLGEVGASTAVRFQGATSGSLPIPATSLSTAEGGSVAHSQSAGSITVVEEVKNTELWGEDFGYGNYYRHTKHIRRLADVNGDGRDDIVAFGDSGVLVGLSNGNGFDATQSWDRFFTYGNYWRVEKHPRFATDMNGDGRADAVGFGDKGVFVSFSTGSGFQNSQMVCLGFGYGQGWRVRDESDNPDHNLDEYWTATEQFCLDQRSPGDYTENPRYLLDINGDGLTDIGGFGAEGVSVAINSGGGFFENDAEIWLRNLGENQGWQTARHVRRFADINGDGWMDAVCIGDTAVMVALCLDRDNDGYGDSLESRPTSWSQDFTVKKGWQVQKHPRLVSDFNGDGLADLAGFGDQGVLISLSTGYGCPTSTMAVRNFGSERGWNNPVDFPRWFHDMDGDGDQDVFGLGDMVGFVSLYEAGGAMTGLAPWVENFSRGQGWDPERHLRLIGDVDGDGLADIVGFGEKGVFVY